MAVGFAVLIYYMAQSHEAQGLVTAYYAICYTCFFFSVISPLFIEAGSQGFEPARFLIFPIRRRRIYEISLAACFTNPEHLFIYPTFLAVCFTGILIHQLSALPALLIVFCIVVFFVVWSNTLILILQSILKKRRAREIVAILSFMILVAFSMLPVFQESYEQGTDVKKIPHITTISYIAIAVGRNLPPSLAAEGLAALHKQETMVALQNVLWLMVWIIAGMALGYYVFVTYHLDEKTASYRKKRKMKTAPGEDSSALDTIELSFVPGEIMAVAAKDLHYLFRSVPGKFNLFVMPVFVIFMAFSFGRQAHESVMGIDPKNLMLFGMLMYSALFSNNFFHNAFAWEGNGIKSYFLSPVPMQRIILGKNIALWMYAALLFMICMGTWSVLVEIPKPGIVISGVLLYGIAIAMFTIEGNIVSIMFPVGRDISAMKNSMSQTATLLSLLSLSVTAAVIAALLFIPMLMDLPFLQPVFLLIFFVIQAIAYSFILRRAAKLLESRKERLIAALEIKD
jgi:hypothetical protein